MTREVTEFVDWQAYLPGVEDAHGDIIDSWAVPVSTGVYAFDPGSTSEPRLPGHDRVIVEPTMYMPTDVVFGAHDRVTARGLLYEVEGATREWRHPSKGWIGNIVTLRRVEG